MSTEIRHVHVGEAIDYRRRELKLTKTELGRRIGVTQQHVNRILERETMETSRLEKVCEALDFNFFSLYCTPKQQITAYMSAVSDHGSHSENIIGSAFLADELEKEKISSEGQKTTIDLLKGQVEQLKSQLNDKNEIIELLKKERRQ